MFCTTARRLMSLALVALASPSNASASATDATLAERAARALEVSALRGARVAVLAQRCNDTKVVFAHDADDGLAPASNQKILTSLAVLALLGPSHRFITRVYADRRPDGNGEVGSLAVRGGGDPALTSEEWWRLAADLRRLGLRRVRGDLVLDDSAFDQERSNPAWGAASSRAYYPAIGSLMANYGSFGVEVRGGEQPDTPARVDVDPPVDYLRVINRATTARSGAAQTLQIDREPDQGSERIVVSGQLPFGAEPQLIYRSVADPTRYAGAVLAMQLAANGIVIDGAPRAGTVPDGALEILSYAGKPLADIVRLLMKYSNNAIAEALVKGMAMSNGGAVGSWKDGLPVLLKTLSALGVRTDGVKMVDGSGLSPANRVSPRALVSALCNARVSFSFGPEFVAALPIAGRDGTLAERKVTAGAVRAKTGMLDGVVGLSGFAMRGSEEIAFSILVNGYRAPDAAVMAAVDGFANVLAETSPTPVE